MVIFEESDDLHRPVPVDCPPEDAEIDSIEGDRLLSGVEEDRALIGRCLAGDVGAWEELYCGTHPALLTVISVLLGGGTTDPNLVDEIASRVWYASIENDGRLLARFDPNRGCRLITFLRTVAKTEVSRHFRRERRERIALRGKPPHQPADDGQLTDFVDVDEFVATLTARERSFWDNHLAGNLSDEVAVIVDSGPISPNARQLRHRIREKLHKFLGIDS